MDDFKLTGTLIRKTAEMTTGDIVVSASFNVTSDNKITSIDNGTVTQNGKYVGGFNINSLYINAVDNDGDFTGAEESVVAIQRFIEEFKNKVNTI